MPENCNSKNALIFPVLSQDSDGIPPFFTFFGPNGLVFIDYENPDKEHENFCLDKGYSEVSKYGSKN